LINMNRRACDRSSGRAVRAHAHLPRYVDQVKEAYFVEHRGQIAQVVADMLALLSDSASALRPEARKRAEAALERLLGMGYCKNCARESTRRADAGALRVIPLLWS